MKFFFFFVKNDMFSVCDFLMKYVILIVIDDLKRNIFLNCVYKIFFFKEIGIV